MRATTALLVLVVAAAAWPPLDRALNDYAALHAAEAEKFAHGDPSGRYVVVAAHHGPVGPRGKKRQRAGSHDARADASLAWTRV